MAEGRATILISQSPGSIVTSSLLGLMHDAYAKAERSRRKWHTARLTSPPEMAARFRQQMLKHQAIAYHLDTECRGCHEPR
jgi:hypothetical protein